MWIMSRLCGCAAGAGVMGARVPVRGVASGMPAVGFRGVANGFAPREGVNGAIPCALAGEIAEGTRALAGVAATGAWGAAAPARRMFSLSAGESGGVVAAALGAERCASGAALCGPPRMAAASAVLAGSAATRSSASPPSAVEDAGTGSLADALRDPLRVRIVRGSLARAAPDGTRRSTRSRTMVACCASS